MRKALWLSAKLLFKFEKAMPSERGVASGLSLVVAGKAKPFRTVRRQSRSTVVSRGRASGAKHAWRGDDKFKL